MDHIYSNIWPRLKRAHPRTTTMSPIASSSSLPRKSSGALVRSDSSLLWDTLDQEFNFDDLQEEDWGSLEGTRTNVDADKGPAPATTTLFAAEPPATQIPPDQTQTLSKERPSNIASGSSSLVSMFDKSGDHIDVDTIDDATWARIMPAIPSQTQIEIRDNDMADEGQDDEVATVANSSQSFPDEFDGDLSPETLAELNRLESEQCMSPTFYCFVA
jgi:hypothetical protein